MTNCDKYDQSDLWAYLRNQLSMEDMVKVQYHILTCTYCRKRIVEMRKFALDLMSVKSPKKKVVGKFYTVIAASFSFFFLAGALYYMLFVKDEKECPIKIQQSPIYEAVDSTTRVTDSLIIYPDSFLKNK